MTVSVTREQRCCEPLVGTLRTRTRCSLETPKPRRARGENAVTSAGKTKVIVHGPDHFSVPNLRAKPTCYQLILLHGLFSNLYYNLSEWVALCEIFYLKFRKKMALAWKRGSEEDPLNIWSRPFNQYFRYLEKRKTFVFLLEVVRSRNLCQNYTKN